MGGVSVTSGTDVEVSCGESRCLYFCRKWSAFLSSRPGWKTHKKCGWDHRSSPVSSGFPQRDRSEVVQFRGREEVVPVTTTFVSYLSSRTFCPSICHNVLAGDVSPGIKTL